MIALNTYTFSFGLWGFLAIAVIFSSVPAIIKAYKCNCKEEEVDSKK